MILYVMVCHIGLTMLKPCHYMCKQRRSRSVRTLVKSGQVHRLVYHIVSYITKYAKQLSDYVIQTFWAVLLVGVFSHKLYRVLVLCIYGVVGGPCHAQGKVIRNCVIKTIGTC